MGIWIYIDGDIIHNDNASNQRRIPNHVKMMFNIITERLVNIIEYTGAVRQDIFRYQDIINRGNEQVQGLRNELAIARNQQRLLNTSLDNKRIEAYQDQRDLQDTLDNEREACQRQKQAMTNTLNDEIRA